MNTSRFISIRTFALAALSGALLVGCQQEIISHNPQSRAQGMKEFEQGSYSDAAGSFKNAIRSDPRDYRSQYQLALCYENLKQYQQAIQAYKAAIDAQQRTLEGKANEAQRLLTMESLATCIAKSDTRDAETNAIEQKAHEENTSNNWLLLAKVHQARGDADSAIDAYNHAVLANPQDFSAAKLYGLYLEQIGQKQKATYTLRKAYTLNDKDEQVNAALSRLNVVPGPGLKDQADLSKPAIPEGPLPEVDLSKFKFGGSSTAEEPAAAQPAQAAPAYNPPPVPTAGTPVQQQPRAVSAPHD